jgi:hypothetical protein
MIPLLHSGQIKLVLTLQEAVRLSALNEPKLVQEVDELSESSGAE